MQGDRVIVPDYPKADTGQLSVSAWVWMTSFARMPIFQNWSAHGWWAAPRSTGQFFFGVADDTYLIVGVRAQNGECEDLREYGKSFPRGQWQHVAFVADGASLHLYRNAVQIGQIPCEGAASHPCLKNLGIGCLTDEFGVRLNPEQVEGPGFWSGRLDEIAIFNHALERGASATTVYRTGDHRGTLGRQVINTRATSPAAPSDRTVEWKGGKTMT